MGKLNQKQSNTGWVILYPTGGDLVHENQTEQITNCLAEIKHPEMLDHFEMNT